MTLNSLTFDPIFYLQQLNSRITSEMMYQSDDWSAGGYDTYRGGQGKKTGRGKYSPYDYGSGYYSSDDEDYEYSGSGSGYDYYDSDEGKTQVKREYTSHVTYCSVK